MSEQRNASDTQKEKRREYMRIYKKKQYANSDGKMKDQQRMYEYRRRLGNNLVSVEKCLSLGEKLPMIWICNISKWVNKFRENETDEKVLHNISTIEEMLLIILKQ